MESSERQEIRLKYNRNTIEILRGGLSGNFPGNFHCLPLPGNFYCISTVFPLYFGSEKEVNKGEIRAVKRR